MVQCVDRTRPSEAVLRQSGEVRQELQNWWPEARSGSDRGLHREEP